MTIEQQDMNTELQDYRTKITARTNQVLEALQRATGKEKAELGREILDRWAADEIHKSILIQRLTRGEGFGGESGGGAGK